MCQVDLTPKGVFVTDLGSSNGTFVNNRKLGANKPTKLSVGQTLTLADQEFELVETEVEVEADMLVAAPAVGLFAGLFGGGGGGGTQVSSRPFTSPSPSRRARCCSRICPASCVVIGREGV